jgi:hypothetical protein
MLGASLALLVLGPLAWVILMALADAEDDAAVDLIAVAMLALGCLGAMLLYDMAG